VETVPVTQARIHISKLITRAEAGEEIVVTRRGRPVARLGPITQAEDVAKRQARVADVFQQLAKLRKGVRLGDDPGTVARQGLD
jgi:prevent-host-death family protein